MNLNNENIDELMFQLLEGEIQGPEREKLLEAIKADRVYSKQWNAWQQTILDPKNEMIVMDTDKLLKKRKKPVMIWWKYSAAAVILLFVGIGIYLIRTQLSEPLHVADKPKNPKQQIIKVPTLPVSPDNGRHDTVITFKQKIEMMAHKDKSRNQVNYIETPERREMKPENEQPPLDKMAENEKPGLNENIKLDDQDKKAEPAFANNMTDESGVIMTVFTEESSHKAKPSLNDKINDRKGRIARIFSIPRIMIVNDSNTLTNRKLILENKEYKIIAGF